MRGCTTSCLRGNCDSPCASMEAFLEDTCETCEGSGKCPRCRGMSSDEIDRLFGDDGCPLCEGAEDCPDCDGEGGAW